MYDVIIIGSGPAGTSAAIYTAKAGLNTLVFDSDQSMTKKAWIENHYGAPDITGPVLIDVGIKQAKKFNAEFITAKVDKITEGANGTIVHVEDDTYEAKHVILAIGAVVELAKASGIDTKVGIEPRIKTVVDADQDGKTNLKNVWAAGTCAGQSVHTIITAGHGAAIAINVISDLKGERYVDHDILK